MAKQLIWSAGVACETALFLEDYFSDTSSAVHSIDPGKYVITPASPLPDILFAGSGASSFARRWTQNGNGKKIKTFVFADRDSASIDGLLYIPPDFDSRTFESALFGSFRFPEKIKVLVIDDEPEIGGGIREYLEGRKNPAFAVESALNGLEGFKALESWGPDVMILDIKMPIKSGHELYREVRKKRPELPVIILTSSVAAEEIAELRRAGSPAIVEKGAAGSRLPEMLSLIKKVWLFS